MKEIVTGACLLAIASLTTALFFAHIANAASEENKLPHAFFGLMLFVAAVAFGFSGCGIFMRGVFR